MTISNPGNAEACARVCAALRGRRRVAITSHVRPDGDAIGSQVALALALEALGMQVRIVDHDPAPPPLDELEGVERIEIGDRLGTETDAVVVLECGELDRAGLADLAGRFVINIDHHPGNTNYGAVNWFDESAAACGELVYDVIEGLGAPMTPAIATHLYVAVLTDTGSFRYSSLSRRTYEIAGRLVEAGADPVSLARLVFDSNTVGRLRLFGRVMGNMSIDDSGRIACLFIDRAMAAESGATYEDTDGLINLPLTVRAIQAVAFFKEVEAAQYPRQLPVEGRDRCRRRGPPLRWRRASERLGLQPVRVARRGPGRGDGRARPGRRGRLRRRRSHPPHSSRHPVSRRLNVPAGDLATLIGRGGVLVVDKPSGPTSHDAVALVRRALGGARTGHTGTLDPAATGVLPLVISRATRLASFLAAGEKEYVAMVRFGVTTDTGDAAGKVIGVVEIAGGVVSRAAIEAALPAFLGRHAQQPPAFSAKKASGVRAYEAARLGQRVDLQPVDVEARTIDIIALEGPDLTVRLVTSPGYYVRAFARDLGERLGIGAHLLALRRTRSGVFSDSEAVSFDVIVREGPEVARHMIGLDRLLPQLPSVRLTPEGARRVAHGQALGEESCEGAGDWPREGKVRLIGPICRLSESGTPCRMALCIRPSCWCNMLILLV